MEIKFDLVTINGIRNILHDRAGVDLNDEQLLKFMNNLSFHTIGDIVASQGDVNDTMTREMIMCDFAKFLVDRLWPINGDGQEYSERFFLDLGKAMKEKGYKLI